MIHFHHVQKEFLGHMTALKDISLKISSGEYVIITGPSGAGKTTLLRLLYGDISPTQGQVLFEGQQIQRMNRSRISFLRRKIGVVFQDFRLLYDRRVEENISIVGYVRGWKEKKIRQKTFEVLREVGLEEKRRIFPHHLSGGEQQLVCLARAMFGEPELLIADEPTGNLDPRLERLFMEKCMAVHKKGTTVILATHSETLLRHSQGRIIVLDQGRIQESKEESGGTS